MDVVRGSGDGSSRQDRQAGRSDNRTQKATLMADESTTQSSDGSATMSEGESLSDTWITWFCSLRGHEFFVEVAKEWIEDNFNLYGLRQLIGHRYDDALDLILDRFQACQDNGSSTDCAREVMQAACVLYGLIHCRFILTAFGLEAMQQKYNMHDFGRCPRLLCKSHPVVPIGLCDKVHQEHVKVYCPRCKQVYAPVLAAGMQLVDGAYFGTTFPHLFFLTFEDLVPDPSDEEEYVPRVFGFRLHCLAQRDEHETIRSGVVYNTTTIQASSLSSGLNPGMTNNMVAMTPARRIAAQASSASTVIPMTGGRRSLDKKQKGKALRQQHSAAQRIGVSQDSASSAPHPVRVDDGPVPSRKRKKSQN
uniref:Casein kinase II subunit beta n=1 Tax=Octactis speculum TaxID=3111310 RepID=A0A7S2FXL8_9STRA|mmetsp:Transcript_33083/g.44800  ORF Transcript_33083/g.44800 Transcript_33083/m.44800 type:complete len:363 (+) Transcript_33083:174-1262(+)